MKQSIFFLVIIVLFVNCAKIKINPETVRDIPAYNWKMYGGTPERTNFYPGNISFPLKLAWRYNASSAIGKTLVVVDSLIYFTTMDGRLYALNIKSGTKVGHKKINSDATAAYRDATLLIAFRYGNDTLFKYNLKRGKYDWKIDAGDIASEPLLLDDSIIITALYNHIDHYDAADGSKKWQTKTGGQIRSSPAAHQGIIVFGCDDGFIYAVDKASGGILWKFKTGASVPATPAIKDSIVYVGSSDKTFYAIQLKTGKLIWRFKTGGQIFHAPAVNDRVVAFGTTDSYLYCLNRFSGKKLWSFEAKAVISTSPLVCKNSIIFGSLDHLYYAVDLNNGQEIWKFETRGRVKTSPVIWGDYLIGASENNYIYAFSNSAQDQ